MSADDTAQGENTPDRRGGGRRKLGGGELTQRLNQLIAELIRENRKLKREVVKLTERGSNSGRTPAKRGGGRAIRQPVKKKAVKAPAKRRTRKTVAAAATRKRPVRKTVGAAATRKRAATKKRRKN